MKKLVDYTFVGKPDIQRVIDENIEDNGGTPPIAIVVINRDMPEDHNKGALLLLSEAWLETLAGDEGKIFDMSVRAPMGNIVWGRVAVSLRKEHETFMFYYGGKNLKGYRAARMSHNRIPAAIEDVKKVMAFKRHQNFRVIVPDLEV